MRRRLEVDVFLFRAAAIINGSVIRCIFREWSPIKVLITINWWISRAHFWIHYDDRNNCLAATRRFWTQPYNGSPQLSTSRSDLCNFLNRRNYNLARLEQLINSSTTSIWAANSSEFEWQTVNSVCGPSVELQVKLKTNGPQEHCWPMRGQ